MQLFDENMMELFRAASADIRLRPAEDDWEKIREGLLPDRSLLLSKETKGNSLNADRGLKTALFIFAMAVISLQPIIRQTKGNAKWSAIVNDQTVKNTKGVPIFQSLAPASAETPFSESHLKIRSLTELTPSLREEWIQPGSNMKSKPAISIYDFRKDTGYRQEMTKQIDGQKKQGAEEWLYGGIIAGPQFNQTKQQGFGNAGFSGGLIAGFHLNNRLSVETGFVISDKQYYSSGKYFDMSKISAFMPAGMKLMQIQSKSTVLEIPLEMRYNLAGTINGNLFVAGGFSSYIITREANQYQAMVNGNNETINGTYSTRQDYFTAAANIGVGYEWRAGKDLNLRFEPYLQIPLKTIGMGSMHVVSTGVYLGLTFPLIK